MSVKKQRNYLLDLLKVLFCITAIFPGHYAETIGIEIFGVPPFDAALPTGILVGGYPLTIGTTVLGFRVLSIAIFTIYYHFSSLENVAETMIDIFVRLAEENTRVHPAFESSRDMQEMWEKKKIHDLALFSAIYEQQLPFPFL